MIMFYIIIGSSVYWTKTMSRLYSLAAFEWHFPGLIDCGTFIVSLYSYKNPCIVIFQVRIKTNICWHTLS